MGGRSLAAARAGLAVAALALACAATPASAHDNAPEDDGASLAAAYGLTLAQGVERLRHQDDVGDMETVAIQRWPSSFAGLWIDHGDGGKVFVAFTSDAAAKAAELAPMIQRSDLVRPVTHTRTMAQLEATQDRMVEDRELVRSGLLVMPGITSANYDIDIDDERNVVTVTMAQPTTEATTSFRTRYGDGVIVERGPTSTEAACSRSSCAPDLRAGLLVYSSVESCTSGFTVRRNDTGNRNILSAAHCDGDNRYHDGTKYGEVQRQQYRYRVDAESHSVNDSFNARPWIFVDVDHKSREVRSRGSWGGLHRGDWVCGSGVTSGKSCGKVKSKRLAPSHVPQGRRFIKAKYCSKGGDSGGPVFIKHRAIGITSGTATGIPCSDPDDFAVAGHIEYALDALGLSMVFP